jgi:5'-nucleotidase (lipoprotein e(P4) family)
MKKTISSISFALLAAILISACQPKAAERNPAKEYSQQYVSAFLWHESSAESHYIYLQGFAQARIMLEEKLNSGKEWICPSVVLDLDETVLNNNPYTAMLIEKGLSYTEETWAEWIYRAEAKALPGAAEFLNFCAENGVTLWYISNRKHDYLDATLQNMVNLGLPNADAEHVLLKKEESDKTPRRVWVMDNCHVLLYLGDNLRDYDEIFKNREENFGKTEVDRNLKHMLTEFILFPNPSYGEWEKAWSGDSTAAELNNRAEHIKSFAY